MVFTKKDKLAGFLLLAYLTVFPFGQLFRVTVNVLDLVAGLIFLYTIFFVRQESKAFKIFASFFLACLFSSVFSFFIFGPSHVFIGGLYLFRLLIYLYFFRFCAGFIKGSPARKALLFNSLVLVCLASAIFGWVQYFWYPDLTFLKSLGWDDHLFRLTGTFLDPGFTGIIIGLGTVAVFLRYLTKKRKSDLILTFFFLVTLAFTYSRASYLATTVGILLIGFLKKRFRPVFLLIAFFAGVIIFLPKPAGQGVNLTRTYSIFSRLSNYAEVVKIARGSPLLGTGFNNLCYAKGFYLGKWESGSHSCSGADSSLLLVLATTGIIGFLIFLNALFRFYKLLSEDFYSTVVLVSGVIVLIHSLFVNSLFYAWIMGYLVILLSLPRLRGKV